MTELKNISFAYNKNVALQNISVVFENSFVHGIAGLNGAGKTTLLNLLAGVLKMQQGEKLFNGRKFTRNDAALLETQNYFYSSLTGAEYLRLFRKTNTSFHQELFSDLLMLPLNELIETYSTGMKKKLALLAVLKQDKPVYIFDEPFNGLDLESNKVLELVIEKLRLRKKTIFISSHILEPLLTVCDKIHHLEAGIFKQSFSKEEFGKIEDALFSHFRLKAKEMLDKAM